MWKGGGEITTDAHGLTQMVEKILILSVFICVHPWLNKFVKEVYQ